MVVQESKSIKRKFQSGKVPLEESHLETGDPLFLTIDQEWNVISAPPSWLTGHLLNAIAYWRLFRQLIMQKIHMTALVPDLGICSKGEVGSVILFGSKPLHEMKSIALPWFIIFCSA